MSEHNLSEPYQSADKPNHSVETALLYMQNEILKAMDNQKVTMARYNTDLPQLISLSGEWECGLAEIQYPHILYNVREEDIWFFLNAVDPEYYHSAIILLEHVNKALKRTWKDNVRAKLSYSTITQSQ